MTDFTKRMEAGRKHAAKFRYGSAQKHLEPNFLDGFESGAKFALEDEVVRNMAEAAEKYCRKSCGCEGCIGRPGVSCMDDRGALKQSLKAYHAALGRGG